MHNAWGDDAQPIVVEVMHVKPEMISRTVSLVGIVKSDRQALLYSEVSGIVQKIAVTPGSFIRKDTLLLQLKNDNLQREYELCRNKEKYAKRDFDRYKGLFNSQHESQKAKESAKERWLYEQINVEKAKKALENTLFLAPFDGVCGMFKVSEGSAVKAGDPLVEFCDIQHLHVYVDVPEDVIGLLKEGQTAIINDKYLGLIQSVQKSLDPDTHMGAIKVKPEVLTFNIGGTVRVRLESSKRERALGLLQEAIFLQKGKMHIYLVKNGLAKLQPIEIGLRGDTKIEITSGLLKDDTVILRGQSKLYDGCPVQACMGKYTENGGAETLLFEGKKKGFSDLPKKNQ
ncbi:MAG: hypothetical protein A2007_02630 [Verrucomicrobia bacterium GWC2_42_7]|nr:MAG: hypothetical protein A2007_02630 [Verrucomicrobia bacterium GWC2_42_7]